MDVQKEVEDFLLEWKNFRKDEIIEKIMLKISKFKKQKNIILFLKVLLFNLEKQTNQIIFNMKNLSLNDNKLCIETLRLEIEKIEYVKTIHDEFKKKYKEEKKTDVFTKAKVDIQKYDSNSIIIKNNCNVLEKSIVDLNEIEQYDLPEAIDTFAHYIRNCNIRDDYETVMKYTNYFCDELVEYLYNENNVFIEFSYLLDAIKNKVNEYEKYSEDRQLLKDIQKRFKNIYKIYSDDRKLKNNQDVYFEILDYYLDKENYFSIQELIKRKPELCSISNNDGHIVLHILKKYIDNFKKMTEDKNSNYINIKYLKEIYDLFTKSPALRIKYEEQQNIDATINEFCDYIKSTLIKRSRKNFALNEAKSMKSNNFYCCKEEYEIYEFREDNITYERQRINNLIKNYVEEKKDCEFEDAFVIGNNAYTICKNEKSICLKMHSLNISPFVKRKAILSSYLEQVKFKNEKIDDFVLRGFKYNKDNKYPVITYNLEFFQSGKLKNLTINRNLINITNVYNTLYNRNEEQQEFFDLYKKSVNKNGGILTTFDIYKMNRHFEDLLGCIYTTFIKEHKLPYIYYGYKKQTDKELEENQNFLASKLNNLDKATTMELIYILTSRIDRLHCTQFPIENAIYDLKIIESVSFLGLENQRMLNDLYFNLKNIEDPREFLKLKEEYYQYYDKKVDELNEAIDYIDMSKIKKYRGRMKIRKSFY